MAHLPLHKRGSRQDAAQPLNERLRGLRHQTQVHHGQGTPHPPLEARRHPGARPEAARRRSRQGPTSEQDGRASVRDNQSLDGRNALQDEDVEARGDRDGPACVGLQHDAGDRDPRRAGSGQYDEGVTQAGCARKCALRMSQDDVRAEDRPQAAETLPTVPINDNTAPSHTASRDSGHR